MISFADVLLLAKAADFFDQALSLKSDPFLH